MTIGHPRQSAGRIMPKVNGRKELGHELGIKVLVESNDPLDIKLLTSLQSIPNVSQVLLHVREIDRLDLHKQVLLLQDIVIDRLLKPVPERTPLKSRLLIHMIGIELPLGRTPFQTSDWQACAKRRSSTLEPWPCVLVAELCHPQQQ